MSDTSLLRRCLEGTTQNRNKCLHNVIWSRCPKSSFPSHIKVELAVTISVGEFNFGSNASSAYIASQGLPGRCSVKLNAQRDNKRSTNLNRSCSKKDKMRRDKMRQARQKEQQTHERQEDGPADKHGDFL